jgi:hypothetical protein
VKPDWAHLLGEGQELLPSGEVNVQFHNGRNHRVRITEAEETLELSAIIARRAIAKSIDGLELSVFRRNRGAQLVSFRIDTRGRVAAQGWVPWPEVTPDEFQLVLRQVAAESDRLEFLLTGRDVE